MRYSYLHLLALCLLFLGKHVPLFAAQFIPAHHPYIRYTGRWDRSDSLRAQHSWPGVTLALNFTGTSLGVRMGDDANYYNLYLDGKPHGIFHGTQARDADYMLAENLPEGKHTLLLTKRNCAQNKIAAFSGFFLDDAAQVLPPAAHAAQYKIEFIGDSFTVAEGNEADAQRMPWLKTFPVTNIDQGFATILARKLNAEYHLTARSGIGMVTDWSGDRTLNLPDRFGRALMDAPEPQWNFEKWQPDLVVIGLGLNDYSGLKDKAGNVSTENSQLYRTKYHAFLATLRRVYPNAKFLAVAAHVPWMREQVRHIVEAEVAQGRRDIHYAQYDYFPGGYVANGHPSAATHEKIAEQLLAAVQRARLWDSVFEHFVTVSGDRLMDGNEELRFISFNIPNLHCIEDNMRFEEINPWRLPEAFEIRDALETAKAMGGTVVRLYTITVRRKEDLPNTPRYVLGPGQFNEEAFRVYDQILALANEVGVRVIIPFVDNWSWMGGRAEYAAFREKPSDAFWSDKQIKADFKKTLEFMLKRVNTITGVPYREDKAILAWETGNELQSPVDWTREMTAYLKKLDTNHLVLDGFYTSVLREESLGDPNTDFVSTHHYERDPREMLAHIRTSAEMAKGKKPYFVGEFGFISTSAIAALCDLVRQTPNISGALIWSLRFRAREGGFYWHSEPGAGGYFFKAYHAPGFASGELYDESNVMAVMRAQAFALRGLPTPQWSTPKAPTLLPFTEVARMTWQGAVGATSYEIERADSLNGAWQIIARELTEANTSHRPLYHDLEARVGQSYYYRVRARNASGVSAPSNIVGPVLITHRTLADEMRNFGLTFHRNERVTLQTDNARAFKEDAHRLKGEPGGEVIYYTGSATQGARVYLFANATDAPLELSASSEGLRFDTVSTSVETFYAGKADYNYAQPMLVTATTLPPNTQFLKLRFLTEAQIGRVEIVHE